MNTTSYYCGTTILAILLCLLHPLSVAANDSGNFQNVTTTTNAISGYDMPAWCRMAAALTPEQEALCRGGQTNTATPTPIEYDSLPSVVPASPAPSSPIGWLLSTFTGGLFDSQSPLSSTNSSPLLNVFSAVNSVVVTTANLIGLGVSSLFTDSNSSPNQAPVNQVVNFDSLLQTNFTNPPAPAKPKSTSTLDSILEVFKKKPPMVLTSTTTDSATVWGTPTATTLGNTNMITFEIKVIGTSGQFRYEWFSPDRVVTIRTGDQIFLRWNASLYTQCFPFMNDNGRYALQARDQSMTSGNTELEKYDIPEISGSYRIECAGQSNGELGIDEKVIRVIITDQHLTGNFSNMSTTTNPTPPPVLPIVSF